jgi:hypothetical protein
MLLLFWRNAAVSELPMIWLHTTCYKPGHAAENCTLQRHRGTLDS